MIVVANLPTPCRICKRPLTLNRALRRMAGLVFLLVFWVLAGACQRHGVGGVLLRNTTTTDLQAPASTAKPAGHRGFARWRVLSSE